MEVNTEVYRTLNNEYRDDPVFFVEHALGHYTWSKQREILRSVRDNKKTGVRACHGSSKTYTAAEITAWFLNCFPKSKVITTAPTFYQVKDLLWSELNTLYINSNIELMGECLTTKIKIEGEPDHFAIGFSTDQPQRAEGWHAPELLFIFDEAKGIEQWMWDSFRGLATGGFVRWLAISTTDGVEVGENFYNVFEDKNSDWNQIHISAYDSPYVTGEPFKHLVFEDPEHPERFKSEFVSPDKLNFQIADQEFIDQCEKDWGKDSVLFVTKVGGEISDQGADTVIKLSQVMRMFKNALDDDFDDTGTEETGVDVARGGSDDTQFTKRKGLKVTGMKTITSKQLPPKEKLEYECDELEIFVEYKKDMIIKVDDTGVGGGVTDIMSRRGYKNVIGVNFNQKAIDEDHYPNAISEMWFEVGKIVHEIACPEPEDERLKRELVNRKSRPLDKKGRRVIESKDEYRKRGKKGNVSQSPDRADSFLLAFYDPESEEGAFEMPDVSMGDIWG